MSSTETDAAGANGLGAPSDEAGRDVIIRIRRQDSPQLKDTARWEEFAVPRRPNMNIIPASSGSPPIR